MASNVTLLELRTRARELADMDNSEFWTNTRINARVNAHAADLYDKLVAAGPPEYYATDATLTTVSGTLASSLPATFRSLVGVYAQEGSTTKLREIYPIRGGTRLAYDAPQGAYNVTLRYVPAMTALSGDADTLDGVSGWEELIVLLCARDMRIKEDSPVDDLMMAIARMEGRIVANAPKRGGGPRFVRDMDDEEAPYWASNPICGYELRAGSIELFQRSPLP